MSSYPVDVDAPFPLGTVTTLNVGRMSCSKGINQKARIAKMGRICTVFGLCIRALLGRCINVLDLYLTECCDRIVYFLFEWLFGRGVGSCQLRVATQSENR